MAILAMLGHGRDAHGTCGGTPMAHAAGAGRSRDSGRDARATSNARATKLPRYIKRHICWLMAER